MQIFDINMILKSIFLIVLLVASILLIYRVVLVIMAFTKRITFKDAKTDHKFAVLIPARNESKVIGDLLSALKQQNYKSENFDVYVIVKDKEDPSIEIVKYFGYSVLVEPNQKCKGDALDFALKSIYNEGKNYDAFIIFDADNVPQKDFIFEINKAVDAGYDIGIGYRNSKNWNDGWISAGTGLTFSLINTFFNKGRTKLNMNCVFSGTGYFIKNSVLEPFKGWPFKTLTEDYEISMYGAINNLKTAYVENAEFFDEQPTDIKTTFKQRVRWVKGFATVRAMYLGKLVKSLFKSKGNALSKIDFLCGVVPFALMVADCIIYGVAQIAFMFIALVLGQSWIGYLMSFIYLNLGIYLTLMLLTCLQFFAERKRINIDSNKMIETILLNPVYMALYIPVAIKAIFTKEVKWSTIEHSKTLTDKKEG